MRHLRGTLILLLSISGVLAQQSLVSTGGAQPALDGGDPGDRQSSNQTNFLDSSAAVDAGAPDAGAPAPAPIPSSRPQAPAKAPGSGPKPAPKKASANAPAPASKQAAKAPGAAAGPAKAAGKSAPAGAKAPGPGRSPVQAIADIINIIEARAGAMTLTNTLFLAGVGPRVDWIANLGSAGKLVGRFPLEQYTSNAFDKSGAWLGDPQAVIQGIPNGQEKSLTMIAILSGPRWNATAETLTFSMRPVTSEAALKLRDGVANGALAGGRSSELRSDAVGVVLRDVVVYIDDSSAQGGAGGEKVASLGLNSCNSINGGPWQGSVVWDRYSGCLLG